MCKTEKNKKNTSLLRIAFVVLMESLEMSNDSFEICNGIVAIVVIGIDVGVAVAFLLGYRGGTLATATKLSGTSTAISRCGPKSYSGGPISPPDDELCELSEPRDLVR